MQLGLWIFFFGSFLLWDKEILFIFFGYRDMNWLDICKIWFKLVKIFKTQFLCRKVINLNWFKFCSIIKIISHNSNNILEYLGYPHKISYNFFKID